MIDSLLLLPFLIDFQDNPDYNASDIKNEIAASIDRNTAIEDYLLGIQDEQYLFDLLAEDGIEPNAYASAVEDKINYFIANPKQLYC